MRSQLSENILFVGLPLLQSGVREAKRICFEQNKTNHSSINSSFFFLLPFSIPFNQIRFRLKRAQDLASVADFTYFLEQPPILLLLLLLLMSYNKGFKVLQFKLGEKDIRILLETHLEMRCWETKIKMLRLGS